MLRPTHGHSCRSTAPLRVPRPCPTHPGLGTHTGSEQTCLAVLVGSTERGPGISHFPRIVRSQIQPNLPFLY
ncbi:hypothetical protein NDU88_004174 [Pleurodeles waltl]|uniref:Uncharacterized protein n=1 Tax=Pleurodeles waltl TaxID=8319 RepID=A0AAV7M8G8_PLEWA|nr:hypothetical protein NDU88_004174 [Pleurodeles waltl]